MVWYSRQNKVHAKKSEGESGFKKIKNQVTLLCISVTVTLLKHKQWYYVNTLEGCMHVCKFKLICGKSPEVAVLNISETFVIT